MGIRVGFPFGVLGETQVGQHWQQHERIDDRILSEAHPFDPKDHTNTSFPTDHTYLYLFFGLTAHHLSFQKYRND